MLYMRESENAGVRGKNGHHVWLVEFAYKQTRHNQL
jgi:hypothetical protein